MENIMIVLLALIKMGVFFIGSIAGLFILALLVQLIGYKIFRFNIYRKLNAILFN